MDLYDAIIKRKSIRHFEDRTIPVDVINTILDYARNVEALNESIDINIEIVECNRNVFSAPYYVALYSEIKNGYAENAGYIMQQIVMYLTAMGLGTCYQVFVGNVAKRDATGKHRVITVAFGYTKEDIFRDALTASRLTQEEICIFKEKPNNNIFKLIEAIRMSPSSMNSQPWRIVVYKNHIHLFSKKAVIPKHDTVTRINIGIAIANLSMAADNQWIDIKKKKLSSVASRKYDRLNYVISVKNILDNLMI